jgi:hypothetical protein
MNVPPRAKRPPLPSCFWRSRCSRRSALSSASSVGSLSPKRRSIKPPALPLYEAKRQGGQPPSVAVQHLQKHTLRNSWSSVRLRFSAATLRLCTTLTEAPLTLRARRRTLSVTETSSAALSSHLPSTKNVEMLASTETLKHRLLSLVLRRAVGRASFTHCAGHCLQALSMPRLARHQCGRCSGASHMNNRCQLQTLSLRRTGPEVQWRR